MITNANDPQITALIRHARRQMASIRATRATYATPAQWAARESHQMRHRAAQQVDYPRTNHRQAVDAARWAVADARRQDNPAQARQADARLTERYGIDPATLEHERDLAWQQGQRDAQRRDVDTRTPESAGVGGVALIAATTAMVVSAELYENAWDWDQQSPQALDATMEQWPEPDNVVDVSDLPEVDQIEPAQIPEGLFPYSIEEQLAHVASNGGSAAVESGAAPEATAEMDMAPAAGPSM